MDNSTKQHWDDIYQSKDTTREVSWYQNVPKTSIDLILSVETDKSCNLIDVGGGDSQLVDNFLELAFKNLFVLDISSEALQKAKIRLGKNAELITWINTDILEFDTESRFDVWHDRATFHFLTTKEDIERYVEIAEKLIKPGGYIIISTFSMNGPKKCSGLEITQYSESTIKKVFERNFHYERGFEEDHTTPFNTNQNFLFSIFRKN